MIRSLSIRNYAIIEELIIDFSDQLTIITGETGAGKSIMLGALGLIMGKRADTKVLYQEDEKCVVEGIFDIRKYDLLDFFKEHDLDYEVETCLRREITPSGKARAFVNDTPVRLTVLKALSEQLLDLHQQFDTQDLYTPNFQLQVIDSLANNKERLKEYKKYYSNYSRYQKKLEQLLEQQRRAMNESDFLQFQLDELLEAELREGEIKELEQEQKRLSNAEDIKRVVGGAAMHISEDENSIYAQVSDLLYQLQSMTDFHPKLPELLQRFEGQLYELQELGNSFQQIAEDTEYDGESLQMVNERLDALYRLLTKHGLSEEEELLALQEDLSSKLKGYTDISEEITQLERSIAKDEVKLFELGAELSKHRAAAIAPFEQKVKGMLEQLSMQHAVLKVNLQQMEEIYPKGIDELKFLFAANKGSRLEEIKAVASGGERSRLALCVKSLVAGAIPLPTIIFDEIDSGVSGEVAYQMGQIMQKLSEEHQIAAITHAPQIAAKADRHYFVHKVTTADRTLTSVRPLEKEERVLEIAKMLSGNPPSDFAKENARELLKR